jgi:hypothetical protein
VALALAVAAAAEEAGLAEVLGLKKSASVFFAGEGDGASAVGDAAVVPFVFRPCFSAGDGDASVAAPGEGEAAAIRFVLRVRFSAGDGDASAVAAGEAGEALLVASAFLCVRCFAGEGDAAGDSLGLGD